MRILMWTNMFLNALKRVTRKYPNRRKDIDLTRPILIPPTGQREIGVADRQTLFQGACPIAVG